MEIQQDIKDSIKKNGLSNWLFVGAHYDDVEIGCGGLLLHVQGSVNINIAVTTSDEHRTGDPKERLKEQMEAISLYNGNLILFESNMEDKDVIAQLDELHYDVVFIPWVYDTHQDHIRAGQIGLSVGRKRHMSVLYYSCGSSFDFVPDVFFAVSREKKGELLSCFKTQIESKAINIDIIDTINSYWGVLSGNTYAEAFKAKKINVKRG